MSSSEEQEDQFVIIEFIEKSKLKSVDLILLSWTFYEDKKLMCRYPPTKDTSKVRNWVMKKKDFQDSWPTYPIKLIATAASFEQGERRLKRSFTTLNVESSEPERATKKDSPLSSQDINNTLSQIQPLSNISSSKTSSKKKLLTGKNTDDKNILSGGSELSDVDDDNLLDEAQLIEKKHKDDNLQFLKEELKDFIRLELNKTKRSILYDLKKYTDQIKDAISIQGAKKSIEESPWKILNFQLPRETDDEFLEFENGLADGTKQDALKEIFHLLTIGSNNYVHDVNNIIKKIINKSVQLLYSGAGRKVKGQGKKSFAQTETYKCMNDFLLEKYKDSKEKINVLTATSHFLSGANDRDGGKKNRKTANEND